MTHQTVSDVPGLPVHALAQVSEPIPECPVEIALAVLSGRWTTLVVRELLSGPVSYTELSSALPRLSAKVLAERLKHLEAHGVVHRTAVSGFPVRVTYALTDSGYRLGPVLQGLWDWGSAH